MLTHQFTKKFQKGSTLLEVLVTMILIALGLLGQAGLVAQSLKVNNSAYMRSQATLLADDMFERMRLNRTLALAGSFNFYSGDTVPTGSGATTIQGIEIIDWVGKVQSIMNGSPVIDVDQYGNAYITITWSELADGALTGSNTSTSFTTMSVI